MPTVLGIAIIITSISGRHTLRPRAHRHLQNENRYATDRDSQENKALETLSAAQQQYPDSEELLITLALLQQQSGKAVEAIKTYEQLIERAPENAVALNNLAWLYHEKNDNRAAALAQKAYELTPDNAAVADTYGWILFKAGQTEKSLPVLEKAHQLQPDAEEIAIHLADAYRAAGRDGDAKRILEGL